MCDLDTPLNELLLHTETLCILRNHLDDDPQWSEEDDQEKTQEDGQEEEQEKLSKRYYRSSKRYYRSGGTTAPSAAENPPNHLGLYGPSLRHQTYVHPSQPSRSISSTFRSS